MFLICYIVNLDVALKNETVNDIKDPMERDIYKRYKRNKDNFKKIPVFLCFLQLF